MAASSKVLVVEDNPILMLDLCDQLEQEGFATVCATTAATAARLLDDTFSALITDIELGAGPDGLALARLAAANYRNLAIVVVSGGVMPSCSELPSGAAFFQKPYRMNHVLAVLQRQRHAHAA